MNGARGKFYLLLFGIGLSAGIWIGFYFANWLQARADVQLSLQDALPTPATGQQNLLVIGVDRLGFPRSRLESLWYIAYIPENSPVVLLPLYPVGGGGTDEHASLIEQAFALNAEGKPSSAFFETLKKTYNFEWNAYVLLDEIAMMEIVDFLGGVDFGDGPLSGPLAVGALPLPWHDPAAALEGQANLLRFLCRRAFPQQASPNYASLLQLIPSHIVTDLDPRQAMQDWRRMISAPRGLRCEFPTLEATSQR